MNYNLCEALIAHLDKDSKCTGTASEDDRAWLTSLGLPKPLLGILQYHWPLRHCSTDHFEVLSVASIRRDEFTPALLKYGFLNVGTTAGGDWLVIDFTSDRCPTGYVSHEEWSEELHEDARGFFAPIAGSFELLLDRIDKRQFIPMDYSEAEDYNQEIERG